MAGEQLDPADADVALTRHLSALTRRALRSAGTGASADVLARQVEMANRIAR